MNRDELAERAASSHRQRGANGIQPHPAWHDLDDEGRHDAYRRALVMRQLEAALDPEGLSGAGRAVLAAIRGSHG